MTFVKVPIIAAMGLALSACALAPVPEHLARPADPTIKVPATAYRSVSEGTARLRPVEPKDWRELNRQVGPQS